MDSKKGDEMLTFESEDMNDLDNLADNWNQISQKDDQFSAMQKGFTKDKNITQACTTVGGSISDTEPKQFDLTYAEIEEVLIDVFIDLDVLEGKTVLEMIILDIANDNDQNEGNNSKKPSAGI